MAPADARRFLAEEIRVSANIRSARLVDALATVPRERFLPRGPWHIRGVGDTGGPARRTDDADPRHVYHDVAIAIDADRNLYNGQPSLIARWIDELAITQGEHVLHIGCGSGYFTSLIAHVVGPAGRVDALDVDAELAVRARVSLSDQPWVHVRHSNGSSGLPAHVNVVLVHAGATHVIEAWLDALADNGRLLVPLTVEFPGMPGGIGKGVMLLVTRRQNEWSARVLSTMPVAIYSLKDLRDESIAGRFGQAMTTGAVLKIRRLRRDAHEAEASCVVHGSMGCLSM
ncbi:MAG TPA: methyltransferase domain-containing protein [Vicinamibacterales bacterium]|nr:methyltransferase domain-containing protein [Vicinamibacterales bacterium]